MEILFLVTILIMSILLIPLSIECSSKYLFLYVIPISLIVWMSIVKTNCPYRCTEEIYTIHIVDNVPIINKNNHIINMSSILDQNLTENQRVLVSTKETGWYGGIYWLMPPHDQITYKLIEELDSP